MFDVSVLYVTTCQHIRYVSALEKRNRTTNRVSSRKIYYGSAQKYPISANVIYKKNLATVFQCFLTRLSDTES